MPAVPLRALLVYDDSLLGVCPLGGTSCNNVIGVTDIACRHHHRPFAQDGKSGLDSLKAPDYTTKRILSDQNRSPYAQYEWVYARNAHIS